MKHPRLVSLFVVAISCSAAIVCAGDSTVTHADAIARVEHGLIPGTPVVGQMGRPLHERLAVHDVPAVSIAVIKDFEVIWAAAYGVADRESGRSTTTETLFQAASISKPVTAMAVHRLVESGRLDLDTEVNDILSSWHLPDNELTEATPVTLRMLLSHSGGTTVHGFPGYEPGDPLPTVRQILDGEAPANTAPIRVDIPPGERFRYSGGGTTIVQQGLVDFLGKPFPELMQKMVLEPVGMTSSTFTQPLPAGRTTEASVAFAPGPSYGGASHVYPEMAAAGLWTTPSDLARFAVEVQHALRGDEGTLISKKTATVMVTPVQGEVSPGFFISGEDGEVYFSHGGGNYGYRCMLIAHRDDGYGAVVMTNGSGGGALTQEVLRAIADEYGWKGYLPEPIQPIPMGDEQLDAYTGRYRVGPDRAVELTRGNGILLHREALRDGVIPLYPVAENTFRYGERFREPRVFIRDEEGMFSMIDIQGTDETWNRLADDEILPNELVAAGRIDEAIAAYRKLEGVDEARLNSLGYELLSDPSRIDHAIAIFRVNTELFPKSFNTWDSLGEAYMAAGKTELAITNYEKSLELDPTNSNAERMLETLRGE